jgi:hypothetical protein
VICNFPNKLWFLEGLLDAKPIFLQTGPAKRLLRTMKAVKEGRPLSQRATTALVRLYASEGFPSHDSLRLQPLKFREDAFPAARVVTRSLPVIPELMFVTGEQNAEEVAGRLLEAPVVLVVRQSEAGEMEFLGYLTEADLRGVRNRAVTLLQAGQRKAEIFLGPLYKQGAVCEESQSLDPFLECLSMAEI